MSQQHKESENKITYDCVLCIFSFIVLVV